MLSQDDPALFSVTAQDGMWQPHNIQGSVTAFYKIKLSVEQSNKLASNLSINNQYIASSSHEVAPEQTNSVEEVTQIVTFDNDKAIIPEKFPAEKVLTGPDNAQHTDALNHSIISFLNRPQFIESFSWMKNWNIGKIIDDGKTEPDRKLDYLIPDLGMTKMVKAKLDGFTSFRATAVLRLQFNSQPFQQGRLILAAIPMPSLIGPRDEWLTLHPSLLQSINHVQVDISKQTEISLRVPFISPFNSYDLITGQYPWSRIVAMVYSPLQDLKGDGVPIQVWIHFEDVVLGTPTSAAIGSVSAIQQAGSVKTLPTQQQVEPVRQQESGGTLKKLAHSVTDGATAVYDTIGENVPFLKPITDIFSALSRPTKSFVDGLINLIGFSKPQVGYSGTTVVVRPCEGFGNANGVDHSHVLGLDRLNNVDVYPGLGGTSFDEQDLNYLTRIPQWVGQFYYRSDSVYPISLWSTFVMPSYFLPGSLQIAGSDTDPAFLEGSIRELQPTILNYVSSFFSYWTGSLVYTFRFMKTSYHSGRVEISFHPFTDTVDYSRLSYAYRAIIDLRENTEVSLVVPFVSPQPWKRVLASDPLSTTARWNTYGVSAVGKLEVRAITPLILSSEVVASSVHCVVEVRAGDDFRLQCPIRSGYLGISPRHNDGGMGRKPIAIQQSGPVALPGTAETRTSAIEGFQPPSITTSQLDTHRIDTQMICAGEKFENFRSLAKKFAFVEVSKQFSPYKMHIVKRPAPYFTSPQVQKKLFSHDGPSGITLKAVRFLIRSGHSPLNQIACMYAFYRGSLRFKTYVDGDVSLISARSVDLYDVEYDRLTTPLPEGQRAFLPYNANAAFELPQQKGFAEFQLPFYSPVIIGIPSDYLKRSQFDNTDVGVDFSVLQVKKTGEDPTPVDVHFAVAAGDDTTFHGFIGLPPCISVQRFTIPINSVHDASGATIGDTSFFQQLVYGSMADNADPCYDTSAVTGEGWSDGGEATDVKIKNLKFSIPDVK